MPPALLELLKSLGSFGGIVIEQYFRTHINIRCEDKNSPSGHDFNQSVTLMNPKTRGIVTLISNGSCEWSWNVKADSRVEDYKEVDIEITIKEKQ